MKNLANCKPSEFLQQTNKIRKVVANWLELTKVMEIRNRKPAFLTAKDGASAEERAEIVLKNKQLLDSQVKENANDILDAMLEKYPDETLKILALLNFVEPEDVDNHPMSEYIMSINELLNDQAVIGFFTSLMQLGNKSTSDASKA